MPLKQNRSHDPHLSRFHHRLMSARPPEPCFRECRPTLHEAVLLGVKAPCLGSQQGPSQQGEQRHGAGAPPNMTMEEQGQFMRRKAAERTAEKRREDVSAPPCLFHTRSQGSMPEFCPLRTLCANAPHRPSAIKSEGAASIRALGHLWALHCWSADADGDSEGLSPAVAVAVACEYCASNWMLEVCRILISGLGCAVESYRRMCLWCMCNSRAERRAVRLSRIRFDAGGLAWCLH